MAIKRHQVKSCCSSKVLILELDFTLKKSYLKNFQDAGYMTPQNFFDSGIFYVQLGNLVATSSYGTTRINVRCSGVDCEQKVNNFEALLVSLKDK